MFSNQFNYARVGDPNGHARVAPQHVARIEIVDSPDARMRGRVLPLEHERNTVGSCGRSHLNVAVRCGGDARLSRANTLFFFEGGRWWVADNGSRYGTWLRGRRLEPNERHALSTGDLVGIGGEESERGVRGGALVRFDAPIASGP